MIGVALSLKDGCFSSCYEFAFKIWEMLKKCQCCSLFDSGAIREVKYKSKSSFELGSIRNSGAVISEKINRSDIEEDMDATVDLISNKNTINSNKNSKKSKSKSKFDGTRAAESINNEMEGSDYYDEMEMGKLNTGTNTTPSGMDKVIDFDIEVTKSHEVVVVMFYISLLDDKMHTCRMVLHVPESDTDLSETFKVATTMVSSLTQICHKTYLRPDMKDVRTETDTNSLLSVGINSTGVVGQSLGMYGGNSSTAYEYGKKRAEKREREHENYLYDAALQFIADLKDFKMNSGGKTKMKKFCKSFLAGLIVLGLIGGFIYLLIVLGIFIASLFEPDAKTPPCSDVSGYCEELGLYNCTECFIQLPYLAPTALPTPMPTSTPSFASTGG